MKWKTLSLQTRLYLVSAIIVLLGLGIAVAIYLTAEDKADSGPGYEVTAPENSKMYMHDLELYGGKANVFADELRVWFDGLWHGKTLAYTIACIALVISFMIFFIARHLRRGVKSYE